MFCKRRLKTQGIAVSEISDGEEIIEHLADRIIGRYAVEDVVHPETGEVIVRTDELITHDIADIIINVE